MNWQTSVIAYIIIPRVWHAKALARRGHFWLCAKVQNVRIQTLPGSLRCKRARGLRDRITGSRKGCRVFIFTLFHNYNFGPSIIFLEYVYSMALRCLHRLGATQSIPNEL